jgi:UDP-N-acetylmuramate dehydrogenase
VTVEQLETVAGPRATRDANIGAMTTYRVGGTARLLVRLASLADAQELIPVARASGLPVTVLGNGSNTLVADGAHDLIVLHLEGDLAEATWRDEADTVIVHAGAGLDLPVLARRLGADGVVGFEWAVGVPGTIGGAVVMNAGGHGSDMAAAVTNVTVMGETQEHWDVERLAFGYRRSALEEGVVLGAELRLRRGDASEAAEAMREIVRWRREHQPGGHNAGSVFTNPPGDHAARLIEASGAKGLRLGSAMVSTKHANFIIVDDGGSASDVLALIREVRRRVEVSSGIRLESEHRFIGFREAL